MKFVITMINKSCVARRISKGKAALVMLLPIVVIASLCQSAAAQKVVVNGTTNEQMIMEESWTGATLTSMDDYFGPDVNVMTDVIGVAIDRAPDERFEWNKKFQKGGWTDNSCAAAAENMNVELLGRGTLPEGWDVRQIGTLGNLTSFENAFAQEAEEVINWWVNDTFSENDFDVLNPPSYAHSLSIVKSPDGNYYTIDNWGSDIKVKKVYPIDSDATYFSSDPNETELLNAGYRLSGLDKYGRGWDEPLEEAKKQPKEQFESQPPNTSEPVDVEVLTSADPNDKTGLLGVGEERYITPVERMSYVIRFENMPDASAPAQEVLVRDTLDLSVFDVSTFELGDIAFGSRRIRVPEGRTRYSTRVDIGDPFEVVIDANLVPETGIVTWRFTTLDKGTNDLPFDPLDGFLPPNQVSPEGEGSVAFSIGMKEDLPSNTVIRNQARIFFDLNDPIDTPPWINVLDIQPPSSSITELGDQQADSIFTVKWAGADALSGVRQYDVYVSFNGSAFLRWLTATYDTEQTFVGTNGNTYGFYSIAYDATGNVEPPKAVAEASTVVVVSVEDEVVDASVPASYELDAAYPNPFDQLTTIRFGLPQSSATTLAVYDMQGREVMRLLDGETMSAGWHNITVSSRGLASGVYFYRLNAGSTQVTKKMTLVK